MKCKISSTGEYKICLGLFSNQMTFENEEITYNSFEYKLLSPYEIDELNPYIKIIFVADIFIFCGISIWFFIHKACGIIHKMVSFYKIGM